MMYQNRFEYASFSEFDNFARSTRQLIRNRTLNCHPMAIALFDQSPSCRSRRIDCAAWLTASGLVEVSRSHFGSKHTVCWPIQATKTAC